MPFAEKSRLLLRYLEHWLLLPFVDGLPQCEDVRANIDYLRGQVELFDQAVIILSAGAFQDHSMSSELPLSI